MKKENLISFGLDAADLEERGQFSDLRYDGEGAIGLDDRVLVEDADSHSRKPCEGGTIPGRCSADGGAVGYNPLNCRSQHVAAPRPRSRVLVAIHPPW